MRKPLFALLILLAIPVSGIALNTVATGFQVGSSQVTIDAHGTCKRVSATDGTLYFVPTNTSAEWSAFRANKPAGVNTTACDPVRIYLTSGTTWTVPADWNSASNTIEVIGGGGGGGGGNRGARGYVSGSGGGGGGYSKRENIVFVPGSDVEYQIGAGGAGGTKYTNGSPGGDTFMACEASEGCDFFGGSSFIIYAKGGSAGLYPSRSAPNLGGQASAGVGSVKYSGGSGENGISGYAGHGAGGGGGGGAAGINGGGVSAVSLSGGSGDAGVGGQGGNPTMPGGQGTEWNSSYGSGGGGGGGQLASGITAGQGGGLYGAGGGGAIDTVSGGNGSSGIIVITYMPQ